MISLTNLMMRMYLKSYLSDIKSLQLIESGSFYVFMEDSKLCKFDTNFNQLWESVSLKTQWLLFDFGDYIYPYRQYNLIQKISKNTGEIVNSIELDIFPVELINNILWCEVEVDDELLIASCDLINFEITKFCILKERRLIKVLEYSKFIKYSDSLTLHSLSDGLELWRLDFSQFSSEAKIRKILVVQGRLFVSASAEYSTLGVFEVDVSSGKILFNTLEMGGELFEFEDKIYTIWNTYLNILHLDTLRVQTIDFQMALKPFGLQLDHSRFVVKGDELYFVSQARNEHGAYVGILDIQDKKLLWHIEIPIEEGSYWIGDVQVHENRLYVLTQGGTLHIFEKDEDGK